MAQRHLDFGTSAANDGETIHSAFQKIEDNTADLYARVGGVSTVNGEDGAVILDATAIDINSLVPANYTPSDPSIEGHLEGIDDALSVTGGGGDMLAANNLSDVSDASTARANLGLTIGTHVQAYDAELAALAGLTSAADRLPYFTGSGTAGLATFTSAARAFLDDADASAMLTTLGVSAFAKTFLDDTSAAAVQATLGLREVLTSNRTYYVRTDGNDANTGLVDSAGGAVSTINQALLLVSRLDLNSYNVTIQLGSGVGGSVSSAYRWVGTGSVTIVGDTTTPANNTLSKLALNNGSSLKISGLKFVSSYRGIDATGGSDVEIVGKCEFGACTNEQIYIGDRSKLLISAAYDITGGGTRHLFTSLNSVIEKVAGGAYTINVTGTPAFTQFALAYQGAVISLWATTFSGGATGKRYEATSGGIIATGGGGANYFPGNSAGTSQETWQYT